MKPRPSRQASMRNSSLGWRSSERASCDWVSATAWSARYSIMSRPFSSAGTIYLRRRSSVDMPFSGDVFAGFGMVSTVYRNRRQGHNALTLRRSAIILFSLNIYISIVCSYINNTVVERLIDESGAMRVDALSEQREAAPLDGLVVLDMAQFLAGPAAALQLGDLGARVIKIERPDGGDLCRQMYLTDTDIDGQSTLFHAINRNKESLALDLK